jgi:nucleotide-binding universal stress UspA family protein
MREIKKVLVAVDLAKQTDKIAEFAIYAAKKFGAQLCFFHVSRLYETKTEVELVGFPSVKRAESKIISKGEEKMAQLVESLRPQCGDCSSKVVQGEVVDEIIAYAKKENIDLIVIGTHGPKNLDKMLLGTVAKQVVKKAPCPVLTCNPYR